MHIKGICVRTDKKESDSRFFKYALIGKIKKFSGENKEQLLDSVKSNVMQEYVGIIDPKMTNLGIYIDVTNIKRELIFVAIEIGALVVLAWIFLKTFQKYKELKMED